MLGGLWAFRSGRSQMSQYFQRARVGFQARGGSQWYSCSLTGGGPGGHAPSLGTMLSSIPPTVSSLSLTGRGGACVGGGIMEPARRGGREAEDLAGPPARNVFVRTHQLSHHDHAARCRLLGLRATGLIGHPRCSCSERRQTSISFERVYSPAALASFFNRTFVSLPPLTAQTFYK